MKTQPCVPHACALRHATDMLRDRSIAELGCTRVARGSVVTLLDALAMEWLYARGLSYADAN